LTLSAFRGECYCTHHPALIKVVTALLSVVTAVAVWPLLPKALAIPSTETLRRVNEELTQQIGERNAALAALQAEKVERLKAEDMLRQSQKMEAIGQLTGGIAHDFNNLLTIAVGNLERLEQKFRDDPDVHRSIMGAMGGATRGVTLTQKLLAFGRVQPLAPQRLDANSLVEGMAELIRRAVSASASASICNSARACGRSRSIPTSWRMRYSISPSTRATRCRTAAHCPSKAATASIR
jgi:signal transduction histidine kinase